MSETKDNGGPAFPRTEDAINHRNRDWDLDGMSLRDYFAAKAMQGVMASYPPDLDFGEIRASSIAAWSYEIADAMLEARKK